MIDNDHVMLQLGGTDGFQFSIATAAYQNLRRVSEYRWPAQERLCREPARQFVGPGSDTVELDGTILPHFRGGLRQTERLRELAAQGEPLELVDGLGFLHGTWVITSVEERRSVFFRDGAPRRIEFQLNLAYYGEDRT